VSLSCMLAVIRLATVPLALTALLAASWPTAANGGDRRCPSELSRPSAVLCQFHVLRRSHRTGDRLPRGLRRSFLVKQFDLEPRASRRLAGRRSQRRATYLLNGPRHSCLAIWRPKSTSGVCNLHRNVPRGLLLAVISCRPKNPTRVELRQVLPDGASRIRVIARDGRRYEPRVRRNLLFLGIEVRRPSAYPAHIRWRDDRRHDVRVPGDGSC
jgi:hypothetical protein